MGGLAPQDAVKAHPKVEGHLDTKVSAWGFTEPTVLAITNDMVCFMKVQTMEKEPLGEGGAGCVQRRRKS